MAGLIAEEFSRPDLKNPSIVWFWFTPFSGLVEQTRAAMKAQFQGLRVRDIQTDRYASGTRSGDVFVMTWASVATSNTETRRLRNDGDTSLGMDQLLISLRDLGFRIGVVVDEAHHGFTRAKEAVRFYRDVMRPEFTLLITATPDDRDVEIFKESAEIAELHRITVSRRDAVDAGLIKEGIKSVAYLATEDQREIIDFGLAAMTDAVQAHESIKETLRNEGLDLSPLTLIQVSSSEESVQKAREQLVKLGVSNQNIASYTATEPDDDLVAVANDDSKEFLIFKMAVALGFDAPRAFVLVSMRGAKDTDFGVQVVGRILRVHRSLQGRVVPETLRFGYVFLADASNQSGLTGAAEKINAIKTELATISPYTMVVSLAGSQSVQVVENGQSRIFDLTPNAENYERSRVPHTSFPLDLLLSPPAKVTPAGSTSTSFLGEKKFTIKDNVLRIFQTERLPISTRELVKCIGASIGIDDRVFAAGFRDATEVTRRQEEIFTRDVQVGTIYARLSDEDIARRSQRVLFEPDYLDPRDLNEVLLERVKLECRQRGWIKDQEEVQRALNLMLATFPTLLRRAARECAAKYADAENTEPLPEFVNAAPTIQTSRLNAYGIMPPDLTEDERQFANIMDSDLTGTIEWWVRNVPRKPHSVGIVLPNGLQYFPDFLVKVKRHWMGAGEGDN
jgi:type III restriction enzyme